MSETRSRPSRRMLAFAVVASTFALLTTGGTIPIPLYTLWGADFGFGASTTTIVFAVYVLGTLLALMLYGGHSDRIGRMPLGVAALGVTLVSALLFLFAQNTPMLIGGRFLSGFGVGLVTSAGTALLAELYTGDKPAIPAMVSTAVNMGGLGLGPLLSGVFAEYLPHPTRLIYVVFLVLVVVASALNFAVPETNPREEDQSIDFTPRWSAGVPREVLGVYWRSALAAFPTFTLLGLFSSLTPRFMADTLQIHNLALAGLATFVLFELGVTTQLLARSRPPNRNLLAGLPLLLVALLLLLGGTAWGNTPLFALSVLVGGIGAGLTFLGGLGNVSAAVEHRQHARAVAAYFIAAQSGLAVPVLMIGALSGPLGLTGATTVVVVVVIAVAAVALFLNLAAKRVATGTEVAR